MNVLYKKSYECMGYKLNQLIIILGSLYGFTGDLIRPLGSVSLLLTLGEPSRQATIHVDFVAINCSSAYDDLLLLV